MSTCFHFNILIDAVGWVTGRTSSPCKTCFNYYQEIPM